jgi:hypothetical protein
LVNEALEKLALEDPIRAEVVKLHYFVGLTHAESAEILQISEKTVRRHWNYARVWLYQTIQSADEPNSPHSGNPAARACGIVRDSLGFAQLCSSDVRV